ncbi:hypothetical protein ALP37_200080 [Pseudomonas amygdali pv. sesami]|nr:hypothetical protein ALO93_200231 [Pseudomonas amygdali pv. sesami]RMU02801.1 hypothetical protein ALP37_200080 [Pseudomonas amygdali pv. sesami]
MAWKRSASNYTPAWLNIVPLSMRQMVWEAIKLLIAGLVLGLLSGWIIS